MEMLLFSMLLAWGAMRYGVTDLVATVKGSESPRHRDRRLRAAQAHERRMAGRQGPTIGEAIAYRIAHRIAQPRPPRDRSGQRPFRRFLGEFWEDTWNDAAERRRRHHERAQARRATARQQPTSPRPDEPPTIHVTAERLDEDRPDEQPADLVDEDRTADQSGPDRSDREVPVPDNDAAPATPTDSGPPAAEPHEPPLVAVLPLTTEGDNAMSGEIYNPESALADANAISAEMQQLVAHLDASKAALEARAVSGAPLEAYAAMLEAAQSLVSAADTAAASFSNHQQIHDVVHSDSTVGDGDYLELAHAR